MTFRRTVLLGLLLLLAAPAIAQVNHSAGSKMGVRLKMLLRQESGTQKSDGVVLNIYVKGDPGAVRSAAAAVGGTVRTTAGDIATVSVPMDRVYDFADSPGILRLERGSRHRLLNDSAAVHVGVAAVREGVAPLPQGYAGAGVIVAAIDSGVDFRHLDFRDPVDPTKSRLLFLWDQNDQVGPGPTGPGYGTEWTQEQLNADLDGTGPAVRHADTNGHGTHVLGTAGGNGAAIGQHSGMAPEADLIMVSVDFSNGTGVLDGAAYIYEKATALGRPAVINVSLGSHSGAHDGSSLEEQGLANLINEAPGRVLVAAAGNEGSDLIHWGGFELEADALWGYRLGSIFTALEGEDPVIDMAGVVSGAPPENVEIALAVDSLTQGGGSVLAAQTDWMRFSDLLAGTGVSASLLYRDGSEAGEFHLEVGFGGLNSTAFSLFILDSGVSANPETLEISGWDAWRILFRGAGTVHSWTEGSMAPESPILLQVGFDLTAPGARYRAHDNNYSVGLPATGRDIISVGASNNIVTFVNNLGQEDNPAVVGDIASFSSLGPSADGRLKPEITAPGHKVISALSTAIPVEETEGIVAPGGKHQMFSGTSMSTPVVSGAIALYLQMNPTATAAEVLTAIQDHATTDSFTGTVPNNTWGYGKLDILAVMTAGLNPTNTQDDVVPGVFSLHANYPNPFNPTTLVAFDLPAPGLTSLEVYNVLGQRVALLYDGDFLAAGRHEVSFDAARLPSGVYLYRLASETQSQTRRMALVK